ncbi:hypothetical protein FPQ18DRAFT_310026 [Pyronema domesticum]|nr:hypothetical protein FPQ18DRAFT_310026 [Pyronema domesticum]
MDADGDEAYAEEDETYEEPNPEGSHAGSSPGPKTSSPYDIVDEGGNLPDRDRSFHQDEDQGRDQYEDYEEGTSSIEAPKNESEFHGWDGERSGSRLSGAHSIGNNEDQDWELEQDDMENDESVIQDMDNGNVVMKWDDDDPMNHAQKNPNRTTPIDCQVSMSGMITRRMAMAVTMPMTRMMMMMMMMMFCGTGMGASKDPEAAEEALLPHSIAS